MAVSTKQLAASPSSGGSNQKVTFALSPPAAGSAGAAASVASAAVCAGASVACAGSSAAVAGAVEEAAPGDAGALPQALMTSASSATKAVRRTLAFIR